MYHRVQIVLANGFVRVRQSVLRNEHAGIVARIRDLVQFDLHLEAAALLRLRGTDGVPSIRRVDPGAGVIEIDYIWGRDLRQFFADGRRENDYEDVSRQFSALMAKPHAELARKITNLLIDVMGHGVIPRDIHAANFIRALRSEKVYLVDFNLIYLSPVPGWRSYAANLASILGSRPEASEICHHSVALGSRDRRKPKL